MTVILLRKNATQKIEITKNKKAQQNKQRDSHEKPHAMQIKPIRHHTK
jgi:hypothetical protein